MTGKTGLSSLGNAFFTKEISEYRISLPEFNGAEICLVDTPGFDNEGMVGDMFATRDSRILNMISDWLVRLYVISVWKFMPIFTFTL